MQKADGEVRSKGGTDPSLLRYSEWVATALERGNHQLVEL